MIAPKELLVASNAPRMVKCPALEGFRKIDRFTLCPHDQVLTSPI